MKTIKLNGKALQITAAEERALRILQNSDWVSGSDSFEEGPRKWRTYILPRYERAVELGVEMAYRDNEYADNTARVEKYFTANPRRRQAVTGNPRRINAIIKQLS
jgi:hypothetical protein